MVRMNADRQKQIELVRMIGSSPRRTPKPVHSAKPVTARAYIHPEIAAVSLVRMTFVACGTKLMIEHADAQ